MKTKLTKSILFLSLLFTLFFPISSFAAIQETSDTISHVEYSAECNAYFAISTQSNDGSWVLYLLSSENENKTITDSLNAMLKDKRINITYDDYESDHDYWEVLNWSIIE